eukprot:893088-Prorocentrum_minimum.AAC.1
MTPFSQPLQTAYHPSCTTAHLLPAGVDADVTGVGVDVKGVNADVIGIGVDVKGVDADVTGVGVD